MDMWGLCHIYIGDDMGAVLFCHACEAWRCKCSFMGSMSVSSCRCCISVSCVHPVAVPRAEFCTTCRLLMLVEDASGDQTAS